MFKFPFYAKLSLSLIVFLLSGCSDDANTNNTAPDANCAVGTVYSPILLECVRLDDPDPDVGVVDTDRVDTAASDMATEDVDTGCTTDNDNDGVLAAECGGDDCDDNDPARSTMLPEVCDAIDNNCNGAVNDGIECWFWAHSNERLYQVDPFAQTIVDVNPVPDLFDMDTHPNGTLYGITSSHLYEYDGTNWNQRPQALGLTNDIANGMAINNEGEIFITTRDSLRTVDITTGRSTQRGGLGIAQSSGDCVVNKGNALFMTSDHTNTDSLVRLSGQTGAATQIGETGFADIWALTAAWGNMYGLTSTGQLVTIDETSGAATLVTTFNGIQFNGAASTPSR